MSATPGPVANAKKALDAFAADPDNIREQSTETLSGPALSDEGPYYFLAVGNNNAYDFSTATTVTDDPPAKLVEQWQTSTWYGKTTYFQKYVKETGTLTTNTHTVEADRPIGITFIGYDEAEISLTSTQYP